MIASFQALFANRPAPPPMTLAEREQIEMYNVAAKVIRFVLAACLVAAIIDFAIAPSLFVFVAGYTVHEEMVITDNLCKITQDFLAKGTIQIGTEKEFFHSLFEGTITGRFVDLIP